MIDSIESQFWTQTKHESKELNNQLIKFGQGRPTFLSIDSCSETPEKQ